MTRRGVNNNNERSLVRNDSSFMENYSALDRHSVQNLSHLEPMIINKKDGSSAIGYHDTSAMFSEPSTDQFIINRPKQQSNQ